MRNWSILLLGFSMAIGAVPTADARSRTPDAGISKRCDAFKQRLQADFIAYRTSRITTRKAGTGRSNGYLGVGITILPRSGRAGASSNSEAFQTFRRKQFVVMAQMRRAGCWRNI